MSKSDRLIALEGTIAAAGFGSGDRFVVGVWKTGPLGPMVDVMWQRPEGRRVLLAPTVEIASFIGGIYEFDETRVVDFDVDASTPTRLSLRAGPVEVEMLAGKALPLFALRPRILRRSRGWITFEDLVLRPVVSRLVLGGGQSVRLRGRSPGGYREWYCIDAYRPLIKARAAVGGEDLGELGPLEPAVTFGFSAFPSRPAFVTCMPLLEGAPSAPAPR